MKEKILNCFLGIFLLIIIVLNTSNLDCCSPVKDLKRSINVFERMNKISLSKVKPVHWF